MIELKYFFPGQEDCTVNLGIQESHYKGIGVGICNYRHGVKWIFNDNEIKLFEDDATIRAYPSPCMNYVVVVYNSNSKLYPAPSNCVVYNLDGTVHKVITTPVLKTPDEKELKKGHSFETVFWKRNNENKLVLCLRVAEDEHSWVDWIQDIEFNAEDGEFGELLSRMGR